MVAMHEAAKRGNNGFITELISAGVSPNGLDKAGNTPLHWACRGGHVEIVSLLLKRKATFNSQNKTGDTPLHLASWGRHFIITQGGHDKVVQALLNEPALNTSLRNKQGKCALDISTSAAVGALLATTGNAADLAGSDED